MAAMYISLSLLFFLQHFQTEWSCFFFPQPKWSVEYSEFFKGILNNCTSTYTSQVSILFCYKHLILLNTLHVSLLALVCLILMHACILSSSIRSDFIQGPMTGTLVISLKTWGCRYRSMLCYWLFACKIRVCAFALQVVMKVRNAVGILESGPTNWSVHVQILQILWLLNMPAQGWKATYDQDAQSWLSSSQCHNQCGTR